MERVQDLFQIRRLNEDLNTLRATLDEEKRRAHLVEEGLLKVKDTLTIEVDRYKSELASLRSEIERRTLKNPLPPPPEPVSFPRYPPFDPKFAHPNGPFWHTQSMFPSSHAPPYPYGQTGQSSRLWPDSERENYSLLHETNGVQRDRKGKSKDTPTRASTSSGASGTSEPESAKPPPSQANGVRFNETTPPETSDRRSDQGFFSRRTPPPSLPSANILPEVSDLMKGGLDAYTLTAMLVPEYMNGFTEGFSSAVRPPEASTSQTSLAETGTLASSSKSASSSERKKRREEKEREKEERHERRRKREADRERREGRERAPGEHRRQEQRRERRASTTNGRPAPTTEGTNPSTRVSSRPSTRGGETNDEASRSSRRPSDADPNHRPPAQRRESLAEVLSDNQPRSRRLSTAGPTAAATTVPPSVNAAPIEHSPPVRVVRLVAPTPRVPIQLTEPHPDSPESGGESPSRASLNTISTWGTIDTSRSAHSNNSSLNIGEVHNFGRYSRDHQWSRPNATPYRPPALQLEPEESSDEEDGESEDENQITPSNRNPTQTANQTPTRTPSSALAPAMTSAPLGPVTRHHRVPSGAPTSESNGARHRPQPRSASTHPPPSTAPVHAHHGSRHTQMIAAYQNPTIQHQRPHTAAIPSGDGTGPHRGGPQGQDLRRAHGFSHSQPHTPNVHPRSQQPPPNSNAGVAVNGQSHTRARSGSSAGQPNVSATPHSSSNANHTRAKPSSCSGNPSHHQPPRTSQRGIGRRFRRGRR
ncbi:hypothetical protein BKA70DRAFT_177626 [Coprinopsis sp. MPI-PUGE-AT-0042]|nr:hypothetical protein BKA70DRAFT_177626 [Coprinopsis sp. MPI-PUGE-AT-0042]